jgi:hypothetical protein
MTTLPRLRRRSPLLLVLALAATALAAPPPVPPTPAPIVKLVSARPFALEQSYASDWRREKPRVTTGYLLVLEVDPDLVYPRQVEEPVLYVGRQTAERLNVGYRSGHVVAIVPAVTDPEAKDYVDLGKVRIWFGAPEMPERVDAARIEAEHDAATQAGIAPRPRDEVDAALKRGGAALRRERKQRLLGDAADLVERYAPEETDLIAGMRRGSGR